MLFPPATAGCYVGAEITPAATGVPPYRKPAVPVTAVRLERGYPQLAQEEKHEQHCSRGVERGDDPHRDLPFDQRAADGVRRRIRDDQRRVIEGRIKPDPRTPAAADRTRTADRALHDVRLLRSPGRPSDGSEDDVVEVRVDAECLVLPGQRFQPLRLGNLTGLGKLLHVVDVGGLVRNEHRRGEESPGRAVQEGDGGAEPRSEGYGAQHAANGAPTRAAGTRPLRIEQRGHCRTPPSDRAIAPAPATSTSAIANQKLQPPASEPLRIPARVAIVGSSAHESLCPGRKNSIESAPY